MKQSGQSCFNHTISGDQMSRVTAIKLKCFRCALKARSIRKRRTGGRSRRTDGRNGTWHSPFGLGFPILKSSFRSRLFKAAVSDTRRRPYAPPFVPAFACANGSLRSIHPQPRILQIGHRQYPVAALRTEHHPTRAASRSNAATAVLSDKGI